MFLLIIQLEIYKNTKDLQNIKLACLQKVFVINREFHWVTICLLFTVPKLR
jgi:hypothetical protein